MSFFISRTFYWKNDRVDYKIKQIIDLKSASRVKFSIPRSSSITAV